REGGGGEDAPERERRSGVRAPGVGAADDDAGGAGGEERRGEDEEHGFSIEVAGRVRALARPHHDRREPDDAREIEIQEAGAAGRDEAADRTGAEEEERAGDEAAVAERRAEEGGLDRLDQEERRERHHQRDGDREEPGAAELAGPDREPGQRAREVPAHP